MRDTKNQILILSSFIFLLLGLATSVIGPILPQLAGNAGVELAQVGAVFTAIFLGALASQLVAGPLGDRIGQPKIILAGLVLISVGMLGVSLSRSLPLMLGLAFLAGLGHGGIDLGGNVLIGTVFNGRSVSALNILNLFFGIGAFSGPALASVAFRLWNTGLPVLWLCAGLLTLAAVVFVWLRPPSGTAHSRQAASQDSSARTPVYRSPLLWILGLLILVYVGTENGIGGWATTYMQRSVGMPLETAALVAASFWLALTAGRMASAGAGLKLGAWQILSASLIGAAVGGILMVFSFGNPGLSIFSVAVIGFSFGAIYPTVMAITTAQFQDQPGKAVSVVAAMGSIGGALLPWAQGAAMASIGVPAFAWFSAGGAVIMLGLIAANGVLPAIKARRTALAGD
jgi:fucose permease